MRKKSIYFWMVLIIICLFTACSQEKVEERTPNDQFSSYIDLWENYAFNEMYDMLTDEAIEQYPPEQFIDRYEKIYSDLQIDDLSITFTPLQDDEIEIAKEEGQAKITFYADMNSVAGPISFDYDAIFVYSDIEEKEGDEEQKEWLLEWDPGFIFPGLADGGEIRYETIEPKRGEILDRNQMPLAINDYVYEIGIVPGQLEDNEAEQKETIARVLQISIDDIDQALSASWVQPDLFVPIKQVPRTEEEKIAPLRQLPAIQIREVMGRVYPGGEAAAHLVGYTGPITAEELESKDPGIYGPNDIVGKSGLELLFDRQLKGDQGIRLTITREGKEDLLLAEKEVKDGENIMVTIDINLQEMIYESFDGEAGTAAALHPETGETLALVSSPAYDPNTLIYGNFQEEWQSLVNDPQNPLFNRFTATYAPGSVIKPITAAIGLKNGTIDPDEGIEIEGLTWSNGENWGDYEVRRVSSTNAPVDLVDALVRSDNIYFAMKAVEMGAEAFVTGLKQFGFEETFPYTYPFTTSTISNSGTLSHEVDVANTSYGQAEIEVSALHLAVTYTPFLNEGKMIKPILLTSEETNQIIGDDLISAEHAELIQVALREVVTNGTGRVANREELAISGKTGTAELKMSSDSEVQHQNGWFIGYPTEEQTLIIAMMVEHAEDIGTSSYAAEKVSDVLIKWYHELNDE